MEDFEEKQASPRSFDEGHSSVSQLQHEYDDVVQKVESDDKMRQVQHEAKLLLHSWPDVWFSKSKRVPKHPLDPETEEVVFALSVLYCMCYIMLTQTSNRLISQNGCQVLQQRFANATSMARSVASHLVRPLTPPDDS